MCRKATYPPEVATAIVLTREMPCYGLLLGVRQGISEPWNTLPVSPVTRRQRGDEVVARSRSVFMIYCRTSRHHNRTRWQTVDSGDSVQWRRTHEVYAKEAPR